MCLFLFIYQKGVKKCEIVFWGVHKKMDAEKLKFISSIGVIDTNVRNVNE